MKKSELLNRMRRATLVRLAATGLLGSGGMSIALRALAADGRQGFVSVKGQVTLDGKSVVVGDIVRVGQKVVTGPASEAVLVHQQNAFLLRENTQFMIDESALTPVLRYISGKVLSVFGKGEKKLRTPTAAIGIRGTGCYIEAEASRTYFCLCYGEAELSPLADPEHKEVIKTMHHEHPLYIGDKEASVMMVKAPVKNHSDAELIMLEGLFGRKPPFYGLNLPPYNM